MTQRGERPRRGASMALDLARVAERAAERHNAKAWPSPRWQADPVGFMRTYLAFEPWDRQVEIAELVRDNPRVAIASGHRIGKTELLAALAIWFYCSFRDARSIYIGPTTEQIDGASYRSTKRLLLQSGRCADCAKADPSGPRPCSHSALITGDVHSSSHHGVKSTNDLREIRGVNVRSEEAAQGIAGENILILGDEASGEYLDRIVGALAGNRAGGARMALFGNPIRAIGEFADAFGVKADFYVTRRISSEESPNVKAGRIVIPGLATRDWIEEQVSEYGGRDSAFFKMRVLGQHVSAAEGSIYAAVLIEGSAAAWKASRDPATGQRYTAPEGELVCAVDPAGDGLDGDGSGFAIRRGNDVLELYERRGLTAEQHVTEALALIARHRQWHERVPLMLDAAGDRGAAVRGSFIAHQHANPDEASKVFDLKPIQSGHKAERDPEHYGTVRDEMCRTLLDWLQGGGCIPDDPKLKIELSRFAWIPNVTGKAKCTPKDGVGGLREQLGRSPTRADLMMLLSYNPKVWQPSAEDRREMVARQRPAVREDGQGDRWAEPKADGSGGIYEQLDPFQRERDPWGHGGR